MLAPIADQVVTEGVTVSITASATDPEGDSLTYTFSGWMDYSGPNNTVSKTTSYNDPSTDSTSSPYSVTVVVSNGNVANDVSQNVTVSVLNTTILVWNAANDPDPGNGSTFSKTRLLNKPMTTNFLQYQSIGKQHCMASPTTTQLKHHTHFLACTLCPVCCYFFY